MKWGQQFPQTGWYPPTSPHGVITQKVTGLKSPRHSHNSFVFPFQFTRCGLHPEIAVGVVQCGQTLTDYIGVPPYNPLWKWGRALSSTKSKPTRKFCGEITLNPFRKAIAVHRYKGKLVIQWLTVQVGWTLLLPSSASSSMAVMPTKNVAMLFWPNLRGGTDESLARPERKQATATILGIYSTHSPRSSKHFLARCSNFCKSLKKKKNQKVIPPARSPRQQWPPRRTKNGDLSVSFSVQGTGGSPTGSEPENRVGDQDIGSPGRPVSSGLQVPGEPGHCRVRTRVPWWPSRGVFPSKWPSIAPAEISNTPRW